MKRLARSPLSESMEHELEVARIRSHIQKIFPHTTKIEVTIDQDQVGKYETLIRVHVPQRKQLIAVKKDQSLRGSVDKCYQAIQKQLQKVRGSWEKAGPGLKRSIDSWAS